MSSPAIGARLMWASLCVHYSLQSGIQSALIPATLSTLQRLYGASHTSMAALIVIYDAFQLLTSLLVSYYGQRYGMRACLAIGAITFALGALLYGIAPFFWVLCLAEAFMGLGSAAIIVLCPAFLQLLFHTEAPVRLGGVYAACSISCIVVYAAVAGFGTSSWRSQFAVVGLLHVCPAAAYAFLHPTVDRHHDEPQAPNSTANFAIAATDCPAINSPVVDRPTISPSALVTNLGEERVHFSRTLEVVYSRMSALLCNGVVMFTILCQAALSFSVAAFMAFVPKFAEVELGQGPDVAAAIMATTIPAATLGMLGSGWVCSHYRFTLQQQLRLCLFCAVLCLPLNAVFYVTSVALFVCFVFVWMFAAWGACVPSVTLFALEVAPEYVPYANGLSNVVVRLLGSIPGPLFLGALLDAPDVITPRAAYLVTGLCGVGLSVVSAIMALEIGLKRPFIITVNSR